MGSLICAFASLDALLGPLVRPCRCNTRTHTIYGLYVERLLGCFLPVCMLWFTAVLLYSGVLRVVGRRALCLFLVLCRASHGGSHRSCGSAVGLGIVMGYAGTPTLPCASGCGWSRGCAQLGVPFGGPGRGWVLSGGRFSSVGAWVLCLGVWFGVPSSDP